jgi:hypothetical protein
MHITWSTLPVHIWPALVWPLQGFKRNTAHSAHIPVCLLLPKAPAVSPGPPKHVAHQSIWFLPGHVFTRIVLPLLSRLCNLPSCGHVIYRQQPHASCKQPCRTCHVAVRNSADVDASSVVEELVCCPRQRSGPSPANKDGCMSLRSTACAAAVHAAAWQSEALQSLHVPLPADDTESCRTAGAPVRLFSLAAHSVAACSAAKCLRSRRALISAALYTGY